MRPDAIIVRVRRLKEGMVLADDRLHLHGAITEIGEPHSGYVTVSRGEQAFSHPLGLLVTIVNPDGDE